MMTTPLEQQCTQLIEELGICPRDEIGDIVPLTGGVASDIASVSVSGKPICIKFALSKLKVAEDWRAPVERNAAEYAWLEVAHRVAPESSIALFGRSESLHGFAMEFIDEPDAYLWKTALLAGEPDRGEAAKVGDVVGRIHKASTLESFDKTSFRNRDDFRALRIDPYLAFTATKHPGHAEQLLGLAEMLYEGHRVLVHGDVSPKNIVFRGGSPVILDAECATMGDACFDPSFCLNHLFLKAVHLPKSRPRLLTSAAALWDAYARHVSWEDAAALEARVSQLVPALMLARVDGKSPAEYLDEQQRDIVRTMAIRLIEAANASIPELLEDLKSGLEEVEA